MVLASVWSDSCREPKESFAYLQSQAIVTAQQHNKHCTLSTATDWLRGAILGRDAIWVLTESCRSSSSCDVRDVGISWLTVSYIFLTPSFGLRSSPRRVSQLSVHCFYIGVSIFGNWSVSLYWVTSEDRKPVGVSKFVGVVKSRTLRRKLSWIIYKDPVRTAQ